MKHLFRAAPTLGFLLAFAILALTVSMGVPDLAVATAQAKALGAHALHHLPDFSVASVGLVALRAQETELLTRANAKLAELPNKTFDVKTVAGGTATINTLPDVGQKAAADSLPFALPTDQAGVASDAAVTNIAAGGAVFTFFSLFKGMVALLLAIRDKLVAGIGLVAGEAHVGAVGGESKHVSVTPALTVGSYASGQCLGGLLTLASLLRVEGKSAVLQSATLRAKIANTAAVDLVIFRDAPSNVAGLTDKAAFAVAVADYDKVSQVVSFAAWNALGGPSVSNVNNIGKLLGANSGVDLKAILVARGAITIASTSDLSLGLGVMQD